MYILRSGVSPFKSKIVAVIIVLIISELSNQPWLIRQLQEKPLKNSILTLEFIMSFHLMILPPEGQDLCTYMYSFTPRLKLPRRYIINHANNLQSTQEDSPTTCDPPLLLSTSGLWDEILGQEEICAQRFGCKECVC